MTMGALVMVGAAILIVVVVEAAARGSFGINPMMGFRFGPLMLSEEAWVAGHKAARIPVWVAGIALAAGAVVVMFVPMGDDEGGAVVLGSFAVLLAAIAIAAWLSYRAGASAFAAQHSEVGSEQE